jgi:hypothetical protein
MIDHNIFNWKKETASPRTFSFQYSAKLSGKIMRDGIWSPEGSAEIGKRKLRFRSNGKANMKLIIYDPTTDKTLGNLDFYWKDFQRSKLEIIDGNTYYFRAFDLFRGAWSWIKDNAASEQLIFRVDNPLHRSGTIESSSQDLPALERDILLLLGLHMQHYLNSWLLTFVLVLVLIITGR